MKFRKTHIWIGILSVGLLAILLQVGGIIGGHDAHLINSAITMEGKLERTRQNNERTQQELARTQETSERLKGNLQERIGRPVDPDTADEVLSTRIQALQEQIKQRGR